MSTENGRKLVIWGIEMQVLLALSKVSWDTEKVNIASLVCQRGACDCVDKCVLEQVSCVWTEMDKLVDPFIYTAP